MSKSVTFTIKDDQPHIKELIKNTPIKKRSALIQKALNTLLILKEAFGEEWEGKVLYLKEPSWVKELKEDLLVERKQNDNRE